MNFVRNFVASEYEKNFGNPSITVRFTSESSETDYPKTLDIFVWYPDEKSDLTTFATCGMSETEFENVEYRSELLLGIEGKPNSKIEKEILEFLAYLTIYPFKEKKDFKWWFSLELEGFVPAFPGCEAIVLHPPFDENGWAVMHYDLFDIQLFNIVPLTKLEHEKKKNGGVKVLTNYLYEKKINIFKPR